MRKTVVTFGTFDLFHVGHLNILRRASNLGSLIVGVSTDEFTLKKKGRLPIYNETHRMDTVAAIRFVAGVFREESFEMKRHYLMDNGADYLVMGDDWAGKFDEFRDICEVIYLARTRGISTTTTIEYIRQAMTFAPG